MTFKKIQNTRWNDPYAINKILQEVCDEIEQIESINGSLYWLNPVNTFSELPSNSKDGAVCLVMDELRFYVKKGQGFIVTGQHIEETPSNEIVEIVHPK